METQLEVGWRHSISPQAIMISGSNMLALAGWHLFESVNPPQRWWNYLVLKLCTTFTLPDSFSAMCTWWSETDGNVAKHIKNTAQCLSGVVFVWLCQSLISEHHLHPCSLDVIAALVIYSTTLIPLEEDLDMFSSDKAPGCVSPLTAISFLQLGVPGHMVNAKSVKSQHAGSVALSILGLFTVTHLIRTLYLSPAKGHLLLYITVLINGPVSAAGGFCLITFPHVWVTAPRNQVLGRHIWQPSAGNPQTTITWNIV